MSAPVGSGTLNIFQKFLFQLNFFGLPIGVAVHQPKEGSEEGDDTDDPGDAEEESSQAKHTLGSTGQPAVHLLGVDLQLADNAGLEIPADGENEKHVSKVQDQSEQVDDRGKVLAEKALETSGHREPRSSSNCSRSNRSNEVSGLTSNLSLSEEKK